MTRTRTVLAWVFALALCAPDFGRAQAMDEGPVVEDPDDFDDAFHPQQKLADKFDVDESQIQSLRDENLGYGEIDHTLTLAERLPGGVTDENVATILEMRQDQKMGWGQIAHEQGTTLGQAKKDFPVQPPDEPPPVTIPEQPAPSAVNQKPSTVQPKSLTRSGKTTHVAGNGSSKGAHSGKSSASRGSSNRSAKAMTASASPARSGHAYGRGGSGGSSAKATGNGKAKGRK